ncbi:MAG: DUF4369 domain-containing protein [Bacteroidales bacterium]|nr:DUF4369 domain-containing protein [Bacteroidales bacterium]
MKHWMLIILAIVASGCSVKDNDGSFVVNGRLENVEDGYMILLFKSNLDGSTSSIAVDTLENGRFEFTAPAEKGVQYHILAPHIGIFPSMSLDFYAEPGVEVEIYGKDYLTRNWEVQNAGKDQKIYQSYFDEVADIFKDLQLLELECRREGRSLDYLRLNKPYHAKIDSISLDWLKSHRKVSEAWMDIMLESAKSAAFSKDKASLNELQQIWKKVAPQHKDSPKGKQVSTVLYPDGEPLKAGDTFPYGTKVYDIDGNEHLLDEFKGKRLLLYFSSHACKPCVGVKKELEGIVRSGKSPVEIVGFNLDGEASWKVGSKSRPVIWPEFNELKGSFGLFRRFETPGVPTFVVVSEDGIILDVWTGARAGMLLDRINEAL